LLLVDSISKKIEAFFIAGRDQPEVGRKLFAFRPGQRATTASQLQ
jgi:hypothetical protein